MNNNDDKNLIFLFTLKKNIENTIYFVNELNENNDIINEQLKNNTTLEKNNGTIIQYYNECIYNTPNIPTLKVGLNMINDKIYNACNHKFVHDNIDIGIDKTQDIIYCKICLLEERT